LGLTYKDAGVDIDVADASKQTIAALAKSTFNANVLKEIGLFAGFFELNLKEFSHPVIVSSIDGVGTKLKIAFMLNSHETVGQDLVNHCVNDIMTCGSDPLFFLDYIGTRQLNSFTLKNLIWGMAQACRQNDCALIGGETAEMPGFYSIGEYDLAGCMIGAVNRNNIIDGRNIRKGDILIGLPSTGLHTNGYSLARKVILEDKKMDLSAYIPELQASWGETLLKIHKSYRRPVQAVRRIDGLKGISHITGGGIVGNTNRLLREPLALDVNWDSWDIPPEFRLIQDYASITDEEMRRVFNLGIGLIFIVDPSINAKIIQILQELGEKPQSIGYVIEKK
jgi:phosphoribosylformylglycinamidine cyclo-ligase